ncbi:MAG: cobalamin-dependent protein [Pseudomonadota bacterium]
MATSGEREAKTGAGMIVAGSAVLRKAIANPLNLRKREPDPTRLGFNAVAADDSVKDIIEGDILPRLLMAFAAGQSSTASDMESDIDRIDTQDLAELPLRLDAANLLEEVDRFLKGGVTPESVYLDMLAPAARRLGEMWENDECDFVDVTMGLWRLQEVMREIAARSPAITDPFSEPRRALFAPLPGDVHGFGAQMIDNVFTNAGWDSDVLINPQRRQLLDYVANKPLDLVGLSISRSCPAAGLASLIKAIRSVSQNPHVCVLIGGPTVNQDPGIVAEVGADGTGVDAKAALDVAERLILAAPIRAYTLG